MPEFLPFAGIRYDAGALGADLSVLVAPPYDVIDDDHRAALEAAHPANAVRLILPRDGTEGDRYARAADTFRRWCEQGVLAADPAPRFYGCRMDFRGARGEERHTVGVIGALALPSGGSDADRVLPHERTLPKAKSDRLALLRAVRANLDPIWGLSLTPGLSGLCDGGAVLGRCTDEDGVEHTLFAIDEPERVAAIARAVGASPLVLADGHHRYETACAYARELRDAGTDPGGAAAIMAFVVELTEEQLCIEPIHRLVTTGDDVRARLAGAFTITGAGPNTPEGVEALVARMADAGALGLADAGGLALLTPDPVVVGPALAGEPSPVAGTDAAVVEAVVVPRLPGASWAYRHDAVATAALVEKGAATAALLLRPVPVERTRAAALAGLRFPQKTTFFSPKPRTGLVLRSLDEGLHAGRVM